MKLILTCIISVIGATLLCACGKKQIEINVVSEQDETGDIHLKWEIYPSPKHSSVEIFASDNATTFPIEPLLIVNESNCTASIPNDLCEQCKYFRLKVDGVFSNTFAPRMIKFENIQNFRDIGGYTSKDGRQIMWNKIYRCGTLQGLDEEDIYRLQNLEITTLIDMGSNPNIAFNLDSHIVRNIYSIPVTDFSRQIVYTRIINNKEYPGDIRYDIRDFYEDMALNETQYFSELINLLANEDNYPVLISCDMGKDQTGLAIYLIMRMIGLYSDDAEEDYLLSNKGIDKNKLFEFCRSWGLTESQQMAFSHLAIADASMLKYTSRSIISKYGSFDNYIENGLKIDNQTRDKLKHILLSNQ